ncbi:hypothetical protein Q9L58_003292 [Maublancomyces gigas]|uniref:Uncharacterized protein n=1 Tax=Discina gigas TaxID=1032678 RepID=A0ABR3GP82_9PEZI
MLANKENVIVHGPSHGAGKINPKTPGPARLNPKTPFKVPLNDDGLKTGKNDIFAGHDPSMFITPAGPRRALTGKTTNAKARLAPRSGGGSGQKSLQKTGRPLRTRFSTTTTETHSILDSDDEAPPTEYMPPHELALPDIPDDFQITDYAKLSTHVYKDCHRSYLYDIDESGKSAIEREVEASDRQMAALLDAETEMLLGMYKPKVTVVRKAAAAMATKLAAENTGTKSRSKRSTTITEKPALTRKRTAERPMSAASNNSIDSRPSTAASIRAATALSQRPSSSASINRPSTSVSHRPAHSRSSSTSVRKPISSRDTEPTRPASRTNSRPSSRMAAANSKTTIGYTTGKEVARSIRKVLEVPKMETALEVCERILREDDERQNAVPAMKLRSEEEECEEGEEVDDILRSLGPMIEEEEEFFISIPGLE